MAEGFDLLSISTVYVISWFRARILGAPVPGREDHEAARKSFRRYRRIAGIGIVLIRWLLLAAIRKEAESRWRASEIEGRAGTDPEHPTRGE